MDQHDHKEMMAMPLHAKPVRPVNLRGVDSLLCAHVDPLWDVTRHWVFSRDSYPADLPLVKLKKSRLSAADEQLMLALGLIRRLDPGEQAEGAVDLFCVPEWAKKRRRPIRWTKDVNTRLGKDTLAGIKLASRAAQLSQALNGEWCITLDMAAWFDQIPLSPEVQRLHCFLGKDGTVYCLTRLPMGQRQAVDVAVAVTRRLLNFRHPQGVKSQDCIDNVRFLGRTREGVIEAAKIFIERCRSIGAQINDIPDSGDPTSLLETMVHQSGDWLGVHYNYVTKHIKLCEKTIDKLRFVREGLRERMTCRQVAGVFGLLFFASSVLDLNLARRFTVLQFFRRLSSALTEDPSKWGYCVQIPLGARRDLEAWIDKALQNTPQSIFDWDTQPEKVIVTDASGWGWGAVCFDTATGTMQQHSAPWHPLDKVNRDRSVETEPEGAYRALCRFLPISLKPGTRVHLLTDSTTAKAIIKKKYSASLAVNRLGIFLERFSHLAISAAHLSGEKNPADAISRGLKWTADDESLARQCFGDGSAVYPA